MAFLPPPCVRACKEKWNTIFKPIYGNIIANKPEPNLFIFFAVILIYVTLNFALSSLNDSNYSQHPFYFTKLDRDGLEKVFQGESTWIVVYYKPWFKFLSYPLNSQTSARHPLLPSFRWAK